MERNFYSEFQECCNNFIDCAFCPLYSLKNITEDCEEIFPCLSKNLQIGIIEKMREKIAEFPEEEDEDE